jgi:hypothetical protein
MSSPRNSNSPVWSPARMSSRNDLAPEAISRAHVIARAGPSNNLVVGVVCGASKCAVEQSFVTRLKVEPKDALRCLPNGQETLRS